MAVLYYNFEFAEEAQHKIDKDYVNSLFQVCSPH